MKNPQPSPAPLYLLDLEVAVTQPLDENLFLTEGAVGLLKKIDDFLCLPDLPKPEEYWLKEDLDKLLLEEKPTNLTIKMKALTAHPEKLASHESAYAVGLGGGKSCCLQMKLAKNSEEADFSLLEKEDGFCWRWLPKIIPWGEGFDFKGLNEKSEDFGSKQKVRWFPRSSVKWVKISNDYPYFQPNIEGLSPKMSKKEIGEYAQQEFETQCTKLTQVKTHLKLFSSLAKSVKEMYQEVKKETGQEDEALNEAIRLNEEQFENLEKEISVLEAKNISRAVEFIRLGFITEPSFLAKIEEMIGKED